MVFKKAGVRTGSMIRHSGRLEAEMKPYYPKNGGWF
jgi:hypothetical protein